MDYWDFVEQVKEQIRDYLPEKFHNAEISVHEIIKNNDCRLDGLSIWTEESNVTPTIYLNPYYAKLQDGAEMEDIHEQAIRNMDILQPYSFRGISETVIDLMAQNIACEEGISIEDARDMAASMMPETKEMMYVLIVPKDAGCDRKER